MHFTPYLEIEPELPINAYLRDGENLYLMGGTVLYKYDIRKAPVLLKKADIAAGGTEFLRKGCAHATAIVDIGPYLIVSLRNSGGGVANMADGAAVGALTVIDKETLETVKERTFENKITYITKYKDLLIVSLHFHGFYIYKLGGDELFSCLYRYIEIEKPRSASTREFQNSAVFDAGAGKINITFASYLFGLSTFTYDLESNCLSPCCELKPEVFPDTVDPHSKAKNSVFGLAAKGNYVYGGLSTGNNRFREQHKDLDWERFDKRGIIYGPHDRLEDEHYQMVLPDEDKPAYIGIIAGDPAPSFLCTVHDYLLFNLDKQGLGVAKIGEDGKLTYLGRTLEDPDGRQLTYQLHFDGTFLYTSYKMPTEEIPPVFRMYKPK